MLALGSSFLAHRREQREPIEIADARARTPRDAAVAEKVALALITLAFVLTFNFFLFRAVGDPRNDLLRVPHMSAAERAHLIHARGLDRSQLDQYGIYVRNTLSGQLETSYHSGRPVTDVIGDALPNTLILALPATLLAALLGTWMGIVSARRRGGAADSALTGGALTLYSMPEQFLAIAVVLVFSIWLKAFPSQLSEEPGSTRARAQPRLGRDPARRPAGAHADGEHPRELEPDHARVAHRDDARRLHDDRARGRAVTDGARCCATPCPTRSCP